MAGTATNLMCLFLILGIAAPSLATEYVVGDSAGWNLDVNLKSWSHVKTFKVGDVLVFKYDPKLHNVVQVADFADLATCRPRNILSVDNSGKTTITLDKPGKFYYISSLSTDCLKGLKMCVTVTILG
ncbi:blue copper protein-like [Lycium ferocissimum]|uniref:blue copper protein-like n=1 Tax=Lycium ferocissimum TaxID=112874 RepID=UPI002815D61C|nr:blue copper protein-like [Lycium ferocissimum]